MAAQFPFNGHTLSPEGMMPIDKLRTLLVALIHGLQPLYCDQTLFSFDDWHQHDGYIAERQVTSWDELFAKTANTESFVASGASDTYVRRAFYPADHSFLLRYYIDYDDNGDGMLFYGDLDLTGHLDFIEKMRSLNPDLETGQWRIESAKHFFDTRYSG